MPPLTRLDPQSLTLPTRRFTLTIITHRHGETMVTTIDGNTEKHNFAFGVFHISIEVAREINLTGPTTPLTNVMEAVEAAWDDRAGYGNDAPFFELVLPFSTTTTKLRPLQFSQPDFWENTLESKERLLDLVEIMLENNKPSTIYPSQPPECCQHTQDFYDETSSSESE